MKYPFLKSTLRSKTTHLPSVGKIAFDSSQACHKNPLSQLEISVEITNTLTVLGLPQPPSNVTVTPVSSTELNVTWSEIPTFATAVTGYEVKYTQLNNIQEDQARTDRVISASSSLSVLLDGLRKYTRYNISVRTLTSEGASPFSTAVETQTDEDGKR